MAITLTKQWQQIGEDTLLGNTGYSNVYVRCYARYTSQDKETNKTNVQVESRIYFSVGTFYSTSGTNGYATVDGETETTSANRTYYSGETTVAFKQKQITHNQDGTKSINVSARWSSQPWGWDNSVGGTVNLPKIDRYAYITDTVQNPNDESTIWFSYENPKELEIGAWLEVNPDGTHYATRTISDAGTSGTYTWELTTQERNQLRSELANANSGTLRIGIYSTISGTIGTSYRDVPFSIVNANPTETHTTTEINTKVSALLGTSANTIVQNVSIVRFAVIPTALKEASISKVEITHNNQPYSDTTSPYGIDIPVVANSFLLKVYDSRGNINNNGNGETITKALIEYQPVDITNLSMKRVNTTSSNIILNLEARYYQRTFGSTANVPTVKWKLGDGSYTTIPNSAYTIDTTNNKLTITNYILTNVLDYRTPGQFTLYIEDLLTTDTEGGERGKVLKGIDTFDAGEHDFKVNGDLYVADTTGSNKVNVLDEILEMKPKKYTITETTKKFTVDNLNIGENDMLRITVIPVTSSSSTTSYIAIQVNDITNYNRLRTRLYAEGSASSQSSINAVADYLVTNNATMLDFCATNFDYSRGQIELYIENGNLCANYNEWRTKSGSQRVIVGAEKTDAYISSINKISFLLTTGGNLPIGTKIIIEKI